MIGCSGCPDLDGDGHPDVGTPLHRDPPLQTTDLNPQYVGEQYPDGHFGPPGVRYLDGAAREELRLTVRNGLVYRSDGTLFDTTNASSVHAGGGGRAIFVMDEHGNMYASNVQRVGDFHHSSFLGGAPVTGAGELQVVNGRVQTVTDHSGHYTPGRSNTQRVLDELGQQGVDMNGVNVDYWAPEGS